MGQSRSLEGRKMRKRIGKRLLAAAAVIMAAVCLFASACAPAPRKNTAAFFDYFDTVITLTVYSNDAALVKRAKEEAEACFSRLNALFDIYNEYEGVANLASVNRRAGETVKVDPDIIALVSAGKRYYETTGGALNIAMGAVLKLWHDCRTAAEADPENASPPDPAALEEASKHCDIDNVVIGEGELTLLDPAMSLDVGAIGKGYAADRAAEKLDALGAPFMLNCGGAVLTNGKKPDGSDWIAGISDPAGGGGFIAEVPVSRAALSTSGSYLRCFTVGGKRYGHIIDPATLFPAEGTESVSVLVPGFSAMDADALSTACFILGRDRGEALVSAFGGASALFALPSGERAYTSGFPGR